MTGIIYKYTSPSKKVYIGQTINPEERRKQHKREAFNSNRKDYNTYFHKAVRKYGFENFKYEEIVFLDIENRTELDDKLNWFESFYIKKYKSNIKEYGYNTTEGGDGVKGHIMTEEQKNKISESLKGNKHLLNVHPSDETKRKISESMKKRGLTEEHKEKIRQSIYKRRKPIFCAELNKIYNSCKEACEELGISSGNLCNYLKGKFSHIKGYHFSYIKLEGEQ